MKVTAYETVDVEVECEVNIEMVLAEFSERVEAAGSNWQMIGPLFDWLTRILASISDGAISSLPEPACLEMKKRLEKEAIRYCRNG